MSLDRFLTAQADTYATALAEIRGGRKLTHWMWFVFPQLAGLGRSDTAKFYGIKDKAEAEAFLAHPVLGERLIEISKALLAIENKTAYQVFGSPDDLKLKSCMTLFSSLDSPDPVFKQVLDKFYDGSIDERTIQLL